MAKLSLRLLLLIAFVFSSSTIVAAKPPIKIFQIGFNKCGTTTLCDFFNANGIPSLHWDHGKMAISIYMNYVLHQPLISDRYSGVVGFFDMNFIQTPEPIEIGYSLFKELDKQYPGSKFILNIRRKDDWLLSRTNHMTKFRLTLLQHNAAQYGVSTPKALEIWSQMWDEHHAAVIEYFKDRPQDLLIFDLDKDSPQKIVDFFAPYFEMDATKYKHQHKTVKKRGMGFNFVDKIYCINLLQSVDRREHMQAEFTRMGINQYEFVQGIDKDDQIVKNMMQSYKVKKYPPCFRCKKFACDCVNNMLIAPQIGNWMSFVKVFEDMIINNVHYAIITEDDIKFTNDAKQILDNLINYQSFAKNNIDLNRPILIRLHGKFEPNNRDLTKIRFVNEVQVSNPCFFVNKKFAEIFLQKLNIINTTSDIFIHEQLPAREPIIQHFSTYPRPVYQLSTGVAESGVPAIFASTIHPKGIDDADMERQAKHVKKIGYWEYLRSRIVARN